MTVYFYAVLISVLIHFALYSGMLGNGKMNMHERWRMYRQFYSYDPRLFTVSFLLTLLGVYLWCSMALLAETLIIR